jgi:hypothetical protein
MDAELKSLLEAMREETATALTAMRQETAAALTVLREENAAAIGALREETAAAFAVSREENAAAHAETRAYVETLNKETRAHTEALHAAARMHADDLFSVAHAHAEALDISMHVHVDALHEQSRELTLATAEDLRRFAMLLSSADRQLMNEARSELRDEIRLVATAVVGVDQKLEEEAADIRNEMRHGFADTNALINYAYGDLDRRVRHLEDGRTGA